jgi:hypothetical protein
MRKNSVALSVLFDIGMKSGRRQRNQSGRRRLGTSFSRPMRVPVPAEITGRQSLGADRRKAL